LLPRGTFPIQYLQVEATCVLCATTRRVRTGDAVSQPAVASCLIRNGKIRRGFIGVAGRDLPLPRRVTRYYNLPLQSGIMVVSVENGSPAQRAGLEEGDIIVALENQPTPGIDELHRLLTERQVGRLVPVTVLRRFEKKTLAIVPEDSGSRERAGRAR
jgi:S1-C subfamily serine protease